MRCTRCATDLQGQPDYCPHCGQRQGGAPRVSLSPQSPVWGAAPPPPQAAPAPPPAAPSAPSAPDPEKTPVPAPRLPPLARPSPGRARPRRNPWAMVMLGFLAAVWGLMLLGNVIMRRGIDAEAYQLPRDMWPCLRWVRQMDLTLSVYHRLEGKDLTAAELKKDWSWGMARRDCPGLRARDVKDGVLVEAVFPKHKPPCRIWAQPGRKVSTNCLDETPSPDQKQPKHQPGQKATAKTPPAASASASLSPSRTKTGH